MDFRTDWTSWILLGLMIIIAWFVNPYNIPEVWNLENTAIYALQILAYPFFAVTIASIPVVIYCWLFKIIPDIDYSIRVGFIMMLVLLIGKVLTI